MENATKALLIAAAVLVVIILIAFGMRILNSGSGTQDQADATMNSAKAQAFNQKFEAYVGNNVSPSSVRNLFALIAQNNQSDPTHAIKIFNPTVSDTIFSNYWKTIKSTNDLTFDFSRDGSINASDESSIFGRTVKEINQVKNSKTYIVRFEYETSGENVGYINWLWICSTTD